MKWKEASGNMPVQKKISSSKIAVKKGEHKTLTTFLTKGWRDKKVITITLNGRGASIEWFICVLGHQGEKFSFDIRIIHKGPQTKSRVSVRSVMMDVSRIDFHGTATVTQSGKGADTYLSFRSLLLSDTAHATMVPSLEILTKDVKAGHAASVERLSDDTLFYSMSRGLSALESSTMLASSFLLQDVAHPLAHAAHTQAVRMISSSIPAIFSKKL